MIKKYLFAFLLFLFYKINAQVTIPDANFKNALINTKCANTDGSNTYTMDVDTNDDGEISIAEIEAVKGLNISDKNINDLKGIEAFVNLEKLNCDSNQLTSLDVSKNTRLNSLFCSSNQLTSIDVSKNTSLTKLFCPSNQLTSIDVSKNTSLTKLNCSWNKLTSLDVSKNTRLKLLYCYDNKLTTLDVSKNTRLVELLCRNNNLTTLDVSKNTGLTSLGCDSNQITSLEVSKNTGLSNLYCGSNQLTSLDVSKNTSLESLRCYYNKLTTLDVSKNTRLTELNCGINKLTTLDVSKNTSLGNLYCADNQITSLDVSKNTRLSNLYCGTNELTSLDVSKNTSLSSLYCGNDQLTSLDVSKNTNLYSLNCYSSKITTLDLSKNTRLTFLDCPNNTLSTLDVTQNTKLKGLSATLNGATELDLRNNPNLERLDFESETLRFLYIKSGTNFFKDWTNCEKQPFNRFDLNTPNIEYICADEPELVCVQKELDEKGYTNCSTGTNCSYNNYRVVGQTAFDSDANGCDTNDPIVPFVKYTVSNNSNADNYTYIGAQSGNYIIPLDDGNYTIAPVFENPTYFTNTPANVTVGFPIQPSPFNQDFCLAANGTNNDLEIVVIPVTQARPGFNALYKLLYKNKGNTVLSGNITLAFQEDYMNFDSASPNTTSQTASLLTWDYQDLLPNQTKTIEFSMTLNQPNHPNFPLNSGDVISFTGTINPTLNDATPLDNTNTLNQTIVNSYDPNDIRCLEGAKIQEDEVGNFVHYIIRFENEGTASAINISVKNEIDITKFDVASLLPLYGSHPFTTTITEGNKLEFRFEGINLSHEENNQGYVVFKMKTANTLIAGDTFEETADIFFDFNSAITTNTAITTVEGTLSVKRYNDTLELYPNPVTNTLTITSKEQIESIAFLDIAGRLIRTVAGNNSLKAELTVSSFLPGTYFIKIKTATTTFTKRIIKK